MSRYCLVLVTMMAVLAMGWCFACQSSSGTHGNGSDADTDSDTDTDADTDSDGECAWEMVIDEEHELDAWYRAVHGTSGDDVYVASHGSNIIHFDGNEWSQLDSPQLGGDEYFSYEAIWAIPSQSVFFAGYLSQAETGFVNSFDGTDWIEHDIPETLPINAVWGSSDSDVYAVGPFGAMDVMSTDDLGVLLHFDGETWEDINTPEWDGYLFSDVWGSGPNDVFVIGFLQNDFGDPAKVLHFDGDQWTEMLTDPTWTEPVTIWGASSSAVYMAMLHLSEPFTLLAKYDGSTWGEVAHQNSVLDNGYEMDRIIDISGFAEDQLYVLDRENLLWRLDDTEWSMELQYDPDPDDEVYYSDSEAIYSASATDVFVVGDAVWHYSCD